MKIRLKFFASFAQYLPAGARENVAEAEVPDGITVHGVLDRFRVPKDQAQLVLIDGIFVPQEERDSRVLQPGQTLAAWPAVAGG